MEVLAVSLVIASAAILLLLGSVHLLYTFHGPKLLPRDPALRQSMEADSPGITRETTMWKAWIGFNASHSGGAMLFGLVYGYLATMQPALLFESLYLMGIGLVFLAGFVFLGKRYWFSVPFRGIVLAFSCYVAGWVLHLL
ncbi:LIC_13387 family protein [Arenimonas aestuarii]